MPPRRGSMGAKRVVVGTKSHHHSGGKPSLGVGVASRRHRKLARDTIRGITKPDIRRLARRGGVKRISADIYDVVRNCLKERLTAILHDCAVYVEHRKGKTITVTDVIFSLRRHGRPIYGFDPDTYNPNSMKQHRKLLRASGAIPAEED